MIDSYIYVIVALLPLAALMLVFQVNPYHALVIRAILGAVAALVDAVLGAADVALTEALVGTMLAITLYVIAVRSSLVMRLGILEKAEGETESYFEKIIANLRKIVNKHHLRLELVEYPNPQALERALMAKEVHAICTKPEPLEPDSDLTYHTAIRVRRLFEIMQTELILPLTTLSYVTILNKEDKH
jgi:putative multicomponent Na+:H+ antiporter subunit B